MLKRIKKFTNDSRIKKVFMILRRLYSIYKIIKVAFWLIQCVVKPLALAMGI